MTEEILLDRHFVSVDLLNYIFNSIEISVLFNLLDFSLHFAFWNSVHESKYLHSYTNQWLYLRMHFPKIFQPVKPMFLMSKILCECENVKQVLYQPKSADKILTFKCRNTHISLEKIFNM
jgi:hypothetical protein